jgi:hypothetical protein
MVSRDSCDSANIVVNSMSSSAARSRELRVLEYAYVVCQSVKLTEVNGEELHRVCLPLRPLFH